MIATSAPFSQYFDKNGDPLDSGYVYFGVPDANPETSPIPAYWDEGGTQPVAQPARTLAGYIVRNGTPARVYVEGAYSQTVKNKKGELVYYAANSEDYSNLPVNVATIEATDGQTNVNLPFSYTRGNNSLAVYLNGTLLLKDRDYIETSETSIQMLNPLRIGPGGADEVTAIGGRLINPSSAVGTVSAAALAAGSGAGLVGFDGSLTYPVGTVGARLREFINVKDAPWLAKGDGVTDDTAAIQAARAAAAGKPIYFGAGTYLTQPQNCTTSTRLVLDDGATIKLINSATALGGVTLAPIVLGASNSSIEGGTVDFNKANQDVAAYNAGGGENAFFWHGVLAGGGSGSPISNIKINTKVINSVCFGVLAQYIDGLDLDNEVEDSGCGTKMRYCDNVLIRRSMNRRIDDDGAKVAPHGFDIFSCTNVEGGNISVVDQSGYANTSTTSLSDWFSGITIIDSENVKLHTLQASTIVDGSMTKSVGFSTLNLKDFSIRAFSVSGYTTVNLEIGSCMNGSYTDGLLDGLYQRSSMYPSETQNGLHEINSGFYRDFSRANRPNTNVNLTNVTAIRCTGPGFSRFVGSGTTYVNCRGVGNRVGLRKASDNVNGSFPSDVLTSTGGKMIGCDFSYNETFGVEDIGGVDEDLINCEISNNGQAKTNGWLLRNGTTSSGDTRGYFARDVAPIAQRIRQRMRGCRTHDDQTVTTAKGSASPSAPTIVSVVRPELYHYGQTITLVGCGPASADLTTQVLDINLDELTVSTALSTFPTVAGTGTISTSGTAVTGSGTAFLTQIQGRTYIVNSGNYRRVVAATTNTAATLESAFPANLSGAAFTIVQFNAAQIRSQDYGVDTTSSTNDLGFIADDHDFGVGNVIANSRFSLQGRIRAAGPSPIVLGVGDFAITQNTPATGTIGTAGSLRPVWLFDAAASERIAAKVYIPTTFGSRVQLTLVWSNAGAGSGDVIWQFFRLNGAAGQDLSVADTASFSQTITAPAQNIQANTVLGTTFSVVPGSTMYLTVGRNGAGGADTLPNDCALLDLIVESI